MRYPGCVRVNPCYAPILKLGNKLNRAKVGCALGVCPESVRQARAAHFNAAFYSTCFGDLLNLFLACEPLAGWRQVAVTQRRTMQDFAHQMRWLVDEAYPEVPVVRWSWTI